MSSSPTITSAEVEPAAAVIAEAAPQFVIMGLAGTVPAFVKALRAIGGTRTATWR